MNERITRPPRFAERLLRGIANSNDRLSFAGDLEEEYREVLLERGKGCAWRWYWMHVLRSVVPCILFRFTWSFIMILNYLKIAIRDVTRHRLYSGITIFGLSVGLTGCVLIGLYIEDELLYDRFHTQVDSIYRIVQSNRLWSRSYARVPMPMGPAMMEQYPEVQDCMRIIRGSATVRFRDQFIDERCSYVDPHFFEFFTFPLVYGDPETVLSDLHSVVLTREMSHKFFGDENPVGKSMTMTLGGIKRDFVVTGVAENVPSHSTIQFELVVPMENFAPGDLTRLVGFTPCFTYIRLEDGASTDALQSKFPSFVRHIMASYLERMKATGRWDGTGELVSLWLQNVKEMHFDSRVSDGSNIHYLYILSAIALIVLVIACINFTNLSIGRASLRSGEIGVRRVLGAQRQQLLRQFWSESILFTCVSMALGLCMVGVLLPAFSTITEKVLTFTHVVSVPNLLFLLVLIVMVGFATGMYPALVMSSFRPVEMFRGRFKIGSTNALTKSLVVVQFMLSVTLMISALIFAKQIHFMDNKDLGFDKEGVVVVALQERDPGKSQHVLNLLKDRVSPHSAVIHVSGSTTSFGRLTWSTPVQIEEKRVSVHVANVTIDYIETMGMRLVEGRDFSRVFSTDTAAVIVNRKLVEAFGLDSPIGETIQIGQLPELRIIGVVQDYHIDVLNSESGPAVLTMLSREALNFALVRVSPESVEEIVAFLGSAWSEIQPEKPFRYSFLDEDLARHYNEERRWSTIIRFATGFALLIACMGIFGLTSITVNRRIKEIGIRKVLGATVFQIVGLINRDFIVLLVIANGAAWPVGYYVMTKVLQNYFYRISIGPEYFILSGIISVVAAVTTSITFVVKAALANPVETLRDE